MSRGRQCLQTFRAPPVPPVPPAPHRVVCVEATQRLCGSHTGCVAATQILLLLYNSTIGAVQQPQGLLLSYNSIIVAAEQARIRPENIESGTNGVGKPPFGLKLCVVRAVPLRMPPACLDCQKTQKPATKQGVWRFSGPWGALLGPNRVLCDSNRGSNRLPLPSTIGAPWATGRPRGPL